MGLDTKTAGFEMAWFSRRPEEGPTTPEAVALREAIAARGPADIPAGQRYVDDYTHSVILAAAVQDSPEVRAWVADRMRVHLFLTIGPYFDLLDQRAPLVAPSLRAEYGRLLADPMTHPASHIIAWWWSLYPALYRSNLDKFFDFRRPKMIESVKNIAAAGGDFRDMMFNWDE